MCLALLITLVLLIINCFNKDKFTNNIIIPETLITGDNINEYIKEEINFNINTYKEFIPGLPKVIWICWFQGINDLPLVVKEVIQSWVKYNEDWKIFLITNKNINNIINIKFKKTQTIQAKSDILRLKLLSTYGGVWADATLLCMKSLDSWLSSYLSQNTKFFMYHAGKINPCSWFIISSKYSEIIQEWNKLSEKYWHINDKAHTYFWMDYLFENELSNKNSIIYKNWINIPYINCNSEGSSHSLRGIYNNKISHDLKCMINNKKKPFVIKLNKVLSNNNIFSNGHYVINLTKTKKDFELVIARYKEDISWSNNYKQFRTIYNKGPDNLHGIEYINRPNIGYEGETFLYHIIKNYYNLANITMFFQGTYNDRHEQKIKNIKNFISDDPDYIYYENERKFDSDSLPSLNNKNYSINIKNLYESLLNEKYNKSIIWTLGIYISVGKNKILKNSINFYINIYKWLIKKDKYDYKDKACVIERLLLHSFINN